MLGLVVGGGVARAAETFGASACSPREAAAAGLGADCVGLVASLAARVGIFAGAATVVMVLLSVGLHRTAVRLEEQRRAAASPRAGPAGE